MLIRHLIFGAVTVLIVSTAGHAGVPCFHGLGDLPGGEFWSVARGVSADGSVVVGHSKPSNSPDIDDYEAFRWTESTGMVGLGYLPGGKLHSGAMDVSADGTDIVGVSRTDSTLEAFRWTETGGTVSIGCLPGGSTSRANAISPDGTIIAGCSYSEGERNHEAFLWTQEAGMIGLGGYWSEANAISADGSVVVGHGKPSNSHYIDDNEAFRWTEETGMVGLGDLPGGEFWSEALDVSADGAIVVGRSNIGSHFNEDYYEAFRWTEETDMVGLGFLPGGKLWSEAYGISADGTVVVGSSESLHGEIEAFIWDEFNGMRSLSDLLINDYSLDLTGWNLYCALAISDDGQIIVGTGSNPSGNLEAWIATIPEPGATSLLIVGALALIRHRRKRRRAV